MIAKGNLHADADKLADYLVTRGKDDRRAELVELRGFAADNIQDAFTDVEIQSKATHCQKPFFHAYVRLPATEHLDREQWEAVADRLEKTLGFTDQPRAIAFHEKQDGSVHMHVAWSRIDTENMKAIDPGLYKNKMVELCRELEVEYGLTRVSSERAPDDKARAANRPEFEESRRLGTDLKTIRTAILDGLQNSDSGKAFRASIEDQGLMLANGDRRDCFVVIDQAGGQHALNKKLTGLTLAQTRDRLADIDRSSLPSVEQAQELQQERQLARGPEDVLHIPTPPEPTPPPHEQQAEQGRGLPAEPGIPAPEQIIEPMPEPAPVPIVHVVREPAEHHHESGFGEIFGIVLKAAVSHFGGEAVIDAAVEHTAVFGPEVHEAAEFVAENAEPISDVKEVTEVAGELHGQKKPGPHRNVAEMAAHELARRGDREVPRVFSAAELATDPAARRAHYAQQEAAQARNAALDRMGDALKQNQSISVEDVRALTRDDLVNMQAKGDDHLRALCQEREKELGDDRDFGRERER